MKSSSRYQYVLIALGLLSTLFLGVFFLREVFPEYKLYQDAYIQLEEFRSQWTKEPPSPFKVGVKQIVMEREDKGPAGVDRCITCHVALQVEAYSKTRIAKDLNGNIVYDQNGIPVKEENPDYIFKLLDEAISKETNPKKAAELTALKSAKVGEAEYPMDRVLAMHPLIGRETRPFEYHPMEEWGCTSCHGGNGRGIVTDKAHGPYLDEQYEREEEGFIPQFLESDSEKDPKFSKVFNHKPGHKLLFQTTPLYVGSLIQAKCIQCHKNSQDALLGAANSANEVLSRKKKEWQAVEKSYDLAKSAFLGRIDLYKSLKDVGYQKTLTMLKSREADYLLTDQEREYASSQLKFLNRVGEKESFALIQKDLLADVGSNEVLQEFLKNKDIDASIEKMPPGSKGSLFEKKLAADYARNLTLHASEEASSFGGAVKDSALMGSIETDVDLLTKDYQKGQSLYISQGCYACHRIAGFARGGVGPELTKEGDAYPWFVKQSIVWPQADLKTSTMPNMKLDHEELEPLLTYILGQTSNNKTVTQNAYKVAIKEWEAGKKLPWEKPIVEKEIVDLNFGMTVFATEGCASCHRLKGYASDVGFKKEDQGAEEWFKNLIPEEIKGSALIKILENEKAAIDQRIVEGVRKDSIIESIQKSHPGTIESFYSNFRFAERAHDDPEWKARVSRVLKAYIQTYGLGRLICPRPNWSGVYRSDQWLMEHFKSPSSLVPRSIMPVFPFDTTKFLALTYMLDKVSALNTQAERAVVSKAGFNPEEAYYTHCAQCHGEERLGNGPVSTWIYPIPKNLTSAEFMRNLTKERAIFSIKHGVNGTPMAPWGEVGEGKTGKPVLEDKEIALLVDWLFSQLPGSSIIKTDREVPKWNYKSEDAVKELNTNDVFDKKTNPAGGPDNDLYFIKQKYYTKENIAAGQKFFYDNCAPCHGKEADGAGLRAEAMMDAKPRMLTNINWLNKHDDVRLLRSIKYGVPGTSMTPWGDLTNPLQRLQLVVFIRSLSKETTNRSRLLDGLYRAFDAREAQALLNQEPVEKIEQIKREKEAYASVGQGFLNLGSDEEEIQLFLKLATAQGTEKEAIFSQLVKKMDQEIKTLKEQLVLEESKIESTEKRLEILKLKSDIALWSKQKQLFLTKMSEKSK